MTTRTSLWEFVSSGALASMGASGLISPIGLQNSTFFPTFRDFAPIIVASFVFFVGLARMVVLVAFYRSKRARHMFAILSMMIWLQWSLGFILVIPAQGVRPGMMQNVWMVIGELLFIGFLMQGRWSGDAKPAR